MKIENKYFVNWSIVIAIILFICNFSIGLSAGEATAETTGMDTLHKLMSSYYFQSEYDDDFSMQYIPNNSKAEYVETEVQYMDNQVKFNGLEPIKINELLSNEAKLEINYRMVRYNTSRDSITIPISDTFYMGEIPLNLTNDEIYWKLSNKNGSWGVGTSFIGNQQVIEDILPKCIAGIVGTNTIRLNNKGIIKGTISLCGKDGQAINFNQIRLDKLKLPNKLLEEITANGVETSKLQIVANYAFTIPMESDLEFDTNYKNAKSIKRMDNKITLQINTTVNH